ncbi:MAG: UDP-N-acetylmuramoyl-tripeptide--D-alanyl-D-alanine ligase [Thiomicrospira sp.]|jgi:UDP-N-acetylmuramoyl-tripeptide--D-alanyl-D-alanine ligase|nr:UDP-N-acetylmuramoyl-tripeptide--D-alanyl-D-alanine ligase [Thiomicrospira sp.]
MGQQGVIQWACRQLAAWAGANLQGDGEVVCRAISTDSRSTQVGDLFIALQGEHFDGHAFIDQAIARGAAAVMLTNDRALAVPRLVVDDTRVALGKLAQGHRLAQPLQALVALTGSNGKTTVKGLLAHILSAVAPTLATQGNFNNDLGVPKTLLQISDVHRYAVIEMGANHPGEIGYLTALARPDIALITLAAPAHLAGFGSLEGVIHTKGEIFNGLSAQGVGIYNLDSAGAAVWAARLTEHKSLTFGRASTADIRLQNERQTLSGIEFELQFNGEIHAVSMPMLGLHNAMNAAAATAVCLALGISWSVILAGLQTFSGVAGRLQAYRLASGAVLLDDSYNANPSSVKAAIDSLVALGGDAVFCFGAMAELGAQSEAAHRDIGEYARQQGVRRLLSFGEPTKAAQQAFADGQSACFASHEALVASLRNVLQQSPQMNILVKGSRSAQMERVVQAVLEEMDHARLF